ncbi:MULTISPECIES: NAD(P)-dependent oxidoreductase [unclassified Undibacterium]|uniref:NAD(P)-dependent oxidoreductase n=1 Tax=unclassified Undibacterium TaxID=2630295 RepID=UPI002AC8C8A4|nr:MULTISPECIES: NAD(P)-dependent oxidoreductase [unclassified Undibacterium]MEB0138132.1 NAD(P)-dependent oxidoreductase [Undibacterium sp. CCC2.1]MEB0171113.1 NAD(P)-dependent oxidoreductase [Undibacterium sp. CCC1.1]MEB0175158.1 NAD(P)-dependent oxidoreductase [Undibacterium sp. CCC3.4]MEB0214258.1 NAD(P)-dependent oxidoreductase [Undibacterium sp. 5I2]WPX41838.1 NAD(P)-dependent oxidoreductase [Undibacterium sp. CCC3.4]
MLQALKHLASAQSEPEVLAAQFADLVPALSARAAALESARCLYCYDAPCMRICPTQIDVPGFIQHIATGNIEGAAVGILQQNILGASCARVCPTEILCEQACVRNHASEAAPVRIGLLQRYALDNTKFSSHPFARAAASGHTVAVVGAGPAGLACAHRLAMRGHDVVIFEAHDKPGGLNEYGIARYKLPDAVAQKEIEFLLGIGGITLRYQQELGKNLHLSDLLRQHAAVFLALGLAASRRLGLCGEDAPGLLPAVEYIAALRQAEDLSALPLPRSCIVIGAGNTAIDMAVQIARLGAEQVTLVYRRGAAQMSATLHEQSIARQNQVRIVTWAAPQQVLLDQEGRVCGMRFERTREVAGLLSGSGESFELPAQAIFTALGQTLERSALAGTDGLQFSHDKIAVDAAYRTSLMRVYAGGDCIAAGQDLTVQAVQHGKLAADAIDHDLKAQVNHG